MERTLSRGSEHGSKSENLSTNCHKRRGSKRKDYWGVSTHCQIEKEGNCHMPFLFMAFEKNSAALKERLCPTRSRLSAFAFASAATASASTLAALRFIELVFFAKLFTFLAGSFSAVSKPIFARKYAFDSIFQDLQDLHTSAPLHTQHFSKKSV